MVTALVAVDIGGTKVAARGEGPPATLTWQPGADPDADLRRLFDVTEAAVRLAGGSRPAVAVVAFPGSLDGAGRVRRWPVRPSWTGLRLVEELTQRWGCRTQVYDDALLAGYAEAMGRAQPGARPGGLLYLGLGTGVGGAYAPPPRELPGRPLRPTDIRPQEIGHIVVYPDSGRRCDCGRYGCVQAYASGRAVHRRCAQVGQGPALDEAAAACALAVANCAELQPLHTVVLGGGFGAARPELPDLLAAQLRHRIRSGTAVPEVLPAAYQASSSLEGARLAARIAHHETGGDNVDDDPRTGAAWSRSAGGTP